MAKPLPSTPHPSTLSGHVTKKKFFCGFPYLSVSAYFFPLVVILTYFSKHDKQFFYHSPIITCYNNIIINSLKRIIHIWEILNRLLLVDIAYMWTVELAWLVIIISLKRIIHIWAIINRFKLVDMAYSVCPGSSDPT